MNENERTEEIEIDLARLFRALWRRVPTVLLAAVVGALIFFLYAQLMITPLYTASATMRGSNATAANTAITVLKTRETMAAAIEKAGLSYTCEQLEGMISAASLDDATFFNITVTASDPEQAALIANTLAAVLPKRVTSLVDDLSVSIAASAQAPTEKTSPNVTKYTAVGLAAGLLLSVAVILVRELMSDAVHRDEELLQMYPQLPILASIPDLYPRRMGAWRAGKKLCSRKRTG